MVAALANIASVAGMAVDDAFVVGVFVMRAISNDGFTALRMMAIASVRMPQSADCAGQHVADRHNAGDSAMVRGRDHDAFKLQMQLNCMIIKPRRGGGQYKLG